MSLTTRGKLPNVVRCSRCGAETKTDNMDAIRQILETKGIDRRHGVIITFPYCGECRWADEPEMPETMDVSFAEVTLVQ